MWEIAYEHQIETWAFWQTEWAQMMANGMAQDVREKGRGDGELFTNAPQIESGKLLQADPIYVDEDMESLWEAAASEFKPEPFEATDLLCQNGFVYLPRPQYMYDVHGRACSWRAFAWALTALEDQGKLRALGINVSLYTHRDDEDDYSGQEFPPGTLGDLMGRYPLQLFHMDTLQFGESFEEAVQNQEDWGRTKNLNEEQRRYASLGFYDTWRKLQALLRLMQQKIATPVEETAPRATRRRAARQGFEVKPVTVIRLRRPKKKREGEPQEVEWSHRWLVGGHWRPQWYPSLGIHRQVYIAPYIKGPEDKELRIREKRAFELVR